IPAQKSIWMFDTADAGSAARTFRSREVAADNAAYQRLQYGTGRAIFMAAGGQEIAKGGYHNHGLFTYAFFEGLGKAGTRDEIYVFDLADYLLTRVPVLSRELRTCNAGGPNEYCQKPVVMLGHTTNFPVVPRYLEVLTILGVNSETSISSKPTHVLLDA